MREPVEEGLKRADAFIVVGHDKAGIKEWVSKRFDKLFCIGTHIEQDVAKTTQLSGKKILAFAGIGFPDKFFDMLRQYGCEVVDTQAFSDHYPYTDEDMTDLIARGSMPLEDISSVHSRIPWIVSRRYSSGSISTQRGSG